MNADEFIIRKWNTGFQLGGLNRLFFPFALIQIINDNTVIAVQISRRIESHDVSVGDKRHSVAEQVGVQHIVGRQKYCCSLFPLFFYDFAEKNSSGSRSLII